jgi:hypothetical protein
MSETNIRCDRYYLRVFVKKVCSLKNNYDQKIVELLTNSTTPMDIEKIRIDVGIGNWNTALKHCLELLVAKKINGVKTSKSWIFWIGKIKAEA